MNRKYYDLDVKDIKLLLELEKDGRASISEIAKKIRVSKEVANYRFKRLQERHIIFGFRALIDYFAMGFLRYRFLINLDNLKAGLRERMVKELEENGATVHVLLQSNWDLEVTFWIKYRKQINIIYDTLFERYSDYINNKEFSIAHQLYYLRHTYIHGSEGMRLLGRQPVDVSPDEEALLHELKMNPRGEFTLLAKTLGTTPKTVRQRLKRLEQAGILRGVIPLIDETKLGYDQFRVGVTLRHPAKRAAVITYLSQNPNITRIQDLVGVRDLSFEAHFPTAVELDDFLTRFRIEVPYVRDFEVMLHTALH